MLSEKIKLGNNSPDTVVETLHRQNRPWRIDRNRRRVNVTPENHTETSIRKKNTHKERVHKKNPSRTPKIYKLNTKKETIAYPTLQLLYGETFKVESLVPPRVQRPSFDLGLEPVFFIGQQGHSDVGI